MAKRNLIGAVVLIVIGIGYAYLTSRLPTRAFENTTEPSFFPWVLTVCLFVLSAALLVQGLRGRTAGGPVPPALPIGTGKYLAGLAAFVVYLAALPSLGFLAANVPFFAALMALYGERRARYLVIGSLAVAVALFYLFREVFQIRLPAGILGDWIP